ncbi:Baculoviral IAP repeat-containing protein 7-B [Lamellibrachia satsuma]|nr:Baculoviral IAP repeat-containing protein 7-B [Lamellibrachia satsuma]
MLDGHFINPNGAMKDHLKRLASFSTLPESAPLFPSIVSKAGFYYPGEGDTVTCYSCGLCLNLSEAGIHPMVLHSELSSGCQCVVTHQSTAMEEDAATERMSIDEVDSQAEVRDSAMLVQSVSTGVTGSLAETSTAASPHGQRSLNLSRSQRRSRNRRQGNYISLATYVGENDRSMHYRSVSPVLLQLSSVPVLNPMISYGVSDSPTDMLEVNSLSLADSVLVNNDSPRRMMERINNNDPSLLEEMKYERHRLVTYANWPRDTNIEPEALAQAGLFYLCRADRVKCAFCYGILRNWEPSEEPMTKHRRLFPRCPFLRNPRAAGNVALGEEPTAEQILNVTRYTPSGDRDRELGIQTARPKHPSLVVEATRLASFERWPQDNPVSPDSLAHAGFYYTGESDEVCCFFCDGHLGGWQSGEDPMTKHRHLYPHCGFVGLTGPIDEPNAANATAEESALDTGASASLTCLVCKTAEKNIVFLPCGHLACCTNCAKSCTICPICRCTLKGSVHAYLS